MTRCLSRFSCVALWCKPALGIKAKGSGTEVCQRALGGYERLYDPQICRLRIIRQL